MDSYKNWTKPHSSGSFLSHLDPSKGNTCQPQRRAPPRTCFATILVRTRTMVKLISALAGFTAAAGKIATPLSIYLFCHRGWIAARLPIDPQRKLGIKHPVSYICWAHAKHINKCAENVRQSFHTSQDIAVILRKILSLFF